MIFQWELIYLGLPNHKTPAFVVVQAERFELTSTALSVLPLTTWVHLHIMATRAGVEPASSERQSDIITVIPTSRVVGEVGIEPTSSDFQSGAPTMYATLPDGEQGRI